ncbi:hypothetical protein QIS96_19080 [Streptomyces sp. B-S-A6]|uniref:SseB protein N-terminal domain-containing protein n=1 Tax=Streptomyces cavernicola TaxID=3043613 RepID=A0ABT6SD66_9ACTN|nr:hypothetical protein [Streptomyces sp. B-S-A6]MDI3405914.1 hypothetical protein [Streptomyces sp. B-S-A6]
MRVVGMSDHGGGSGMPGRVPPSKISGLDVSGPPGLKGPPASVVPSVPHGNPAAVGGPTAEQARRQFASLLGQFRRTAVLVPLTGGGAGAEGAVQGGGFWTAEHGGIRWILGFSDEGALARFALARGEGARPWEYQTVLGARLLDVAVPAVARDGMPCGVALDTADEQDALLFPPVTGVVPDAVAIDA